MQLSFLTPEAALVAIGVVVPLAVLVAARRSAVRTALMLGLEPSDRRNVPVVVALAVLAGLLGLAAAQPVVHSEGETRVRDDAEALFVFDTSRSMLASAGPGARTRFERAREAALAMRDALADVPVGVASFTDRVLPHLFATPRSEGFEATVTRALAVDRPPPLGRSTTRSTALGTLVAIPERRYFSPQAERRLVVVFTDGESTPVDAARLRATYRRAEYGAVFLRFWEPGERVFGPGGVPEAYASDPTSGSVLRAVAAAMGGEVVEEGDVARAVDAGRDFLGSGSTTVVGRDERPVSIAPYAVLAAVLPLGFVLWRRNA